ncbi:Retrovirus-related Pol polyprotein from transposon [Dictyocoela muelleri]|nr:Retrovirus-related Pol polyprotein from transposon [Dictyocoela muelleri]
MKNQTLSHVDLNKSFILEVDASESGMGATLFQDKNINGFYSTSFKKHERNYTISEKEFLSIIKSLNHFRQIILGSKITIRTDHANNLFNKDLTTRKKRWKILLQEYDYELEYVEEKETTRQIFCHVSLSKKTK